MELGMNSTAVGIEKWETKPTDYTPLESLLNVEFRQNNKICWV